MENFISTKNSTIETLIASDTYTGTIEDVAKFTNVSINIICTEDSASGGLSIEFSNTTDFLTSKIYKYTYYKNISKTYNIPVSNRFFRVKYTNGLIVSNIDIRTILNNINSNQQYCNFNDNLVDTFGRLRTSQLYTVFDYDQVYGKNYLKEDEYIDGSGSATNTNAMITLTCTGTGHVIRQSRLYAKYQPGKSFYIMMSGIINNGSNGTDVISRIGYYDNGDGLFFQHTGGTNIISVVERQNGSDTLIEQSNWNIDTMDGSGTSGINIDFTKYLIFTINFSWLGAGIVRMGLFYSGKHYIVHEFKHTEITLPYIIKPHLPTRYEIISTSGNSGSMKEACVSISSEGGQQFTGQIYSIGNQTLRTISENETYICGLRLKQDSRLMVKIQSLSLICTTKGNIEYKIYLVKSPSSNPITTSNFTDVNSNSVVQYDASGTAFSTTDSIVLYRGYFSDLLNINTRDLGTQDDPIYLTAGIETGSNFKSDYLFITGRKLANGNESVFSTFSWIEI